MISGLADFDYPLPKELIAQKPLDRRDASRLLVVDRKSGKLADEVFSNLPAYIPPADVLVLNNTKVFPARLFGRKKITEGKVDLLLLEPAETGPAAPSIWRCLVQPSMKEGQQVFFPGTEAEAVFLKRDSAGVPLFEFMNVEDPRGLAERIGTVPLPPYIKRQADAKDRELYQTVYAEKEGAVAAPTAGLHFTKELMAEIRSKRIEVCFLTLHVGYGTFKPVEDLKTHRMHAEAFELPPETADRINSARSGRKKVWAVGTTTLRVLETCVQKKRLMAGSGQTDLFIQEPFEFEAADHLLTNFHLPKTTLLLLVSAFMGGALRKKAYAHAIENRYRFYSYGDAMLII